MDTAEQVVRDVGQWTDASDLSVEAYLMWDDENLYLGATIMDDTPFHVPRGLPRRIWPTRWCCSFPPNPEADPARTEYTANDFRLTMVIDDYYYNTGIDRDMIADNKGLKALAPMATWQVLTGYECAVKRSKAATP